MRVLYLDCNMGIAGDMLMSALWELSVNKEQLIEEINSIGLPYTKISFEKRTTCGVSGTHALVLVDGEEEHNAHSHHHRGLADVTEIINSLNLSDKVKANASAVYDIIAAAEARVHGEDVNMVHFHEVGMLDAIADVVVCSLLLDKLSVDEVIASPINAGSGTVNCAHGILPVPAPATQMILEGIPYYKSDILCELCTPTGAALLKHYASYIGNMPRLNIASAGFGIGSKEFDRPNCVRAYIGDADDSSLAIELMCNVDDMPAEDISFAVSALMKNGALDASAQSIMMKKGRVGYLIRAICRPVDKVKMIDLIFNHTTTIGIRQSLCSREMLDRNIKTIETPYGKIDVKYSSLNGVNKSKIEYDSLSSLAEKNNISISKMRKLLDEYI